MVDFREIRIGSCLLNTVGQPCVVCGLTPDLVTLGRIEDGNVVENSQLPYNDVQPIIITEDWLNRFGFIQKPHTWSDRSVSEDYYWFGKYNVGFEKGYAFFGQEAYDKSAQWLASIEYVHQLQNLYFSITGKELTL